MNFDLRFPIGVLFGLIGLILTGYGFATKANVAMYEKSLGKNVNIEWGIVLLVFAGFMLALSLSSKKE